MWADALYLAEYNHVLRLAIWGAGCTLVGTLLVLGLTLSRAVSPLVRHFAIQTAAWGAVELLVGLVSRHGLAYRDLAGYTRLDRSLWLNLGLETGYVMVGLTLAILGWRLGRRLALVGAGTGVVVQGLALLTLDAYMLGVLRRLAAG
ncbi:MAG TPA: hypothetical protein VFS08_10925 [Gemmatimonadaceae bacterium]|nr:hypothetical protein [Gemmatimonadaceae bacterium]